jgi:hypothetical protein
MKLRLWDDNAGTFYGLSISAGALEYMVPSTAGHFFYTNGNTTCRLSVVSGGQVGVNTNAPSASYALDVNGSCHATSFPTSSDARFKKNVRPLTDALHKVTQLRGVAYEWNEFVNSRRDGYKLDVTHIGVVAQEVEEIIPEIVERWELSPDCQDARSVDYTRMVPYLIEAIKEQHVQISDLTNRLSQLELRSS